MVPAQHGGSSRGTSGLYDVLELILERGLVIDAEIRISVIGIELIKIDVRIVIASVDTYLRFAEACNRLDLDGGPGKRPGLPELIGDMTGGGSRDETKHTGSTSRRGA